MRKTVQQLLSPDFEDEREVPDESSTTFTKNMGLPVHRWFRYSAGFSAEWVQQVIKEHRKRKSLRIFDPFAGSATTLLAAESMEVSSVGIDSHPFVSRVAKAKLAWRTCPEEYVQFCDELKKLAMSYKKMPSEDDYPPLIYKCYDPGTLQKLDAFRRAYEKLRDESAASQLGWLTLVSILRKTSFAGTAQWQYVLPKKQKRSAQDVVVAFDSCVSMFYEDMRIGSKLAGPRAEFFQSDARTCEGIANKSVDLVITSPPYPNNYDYADAVRLEMSFMKDIAGWGDLQTSIRQYLVRSCTQHVPERAVNLSEVLAALELEPIHDELNQVCSQLAEIRKTKGGKKTYHLMVACYFRDLALVWKSMRRVCTKGSRACFVIGDSAPYGVYVPVIPWLGKLAVAAGFKSFEFEKTRDRNIKWKNRKHRVPLQEGRLWVEG
jgi:hypothetical protein